MVDWVTLVSSILVSGGTVFAGAKWLIGRAVDHSLDMRLETHRDGLARATGEAQTKLQGILNTELETHRDRLARETGEELEQLRTTLASEASAAQALLEASLRRADELVLGEEAAERSYRYEARKRLYGAVGPLRFQLLTAAAQFPRLLDSLDKYSYATSMDHYFGRSFLFRTARLLALTELIERQVGYADFAVDPAIIVLLRFRGQILRAFSSGDVAMNHPDADWSRQKEHIFRDQQPVLAISMVTKDGNSERVIRFDEFEAVLGDGKGGYLQPLTKMVASVDATRTPIFWLRLLAVGAACDGLLQGESIAAALDPLALDYDSLLKKSKDKFIRQNHKKILEMLADFRAKIALPPSLGLSP